MPHSVALLCNDVSTCHLTHSKLVKRAVSGYILLEERTQPTSLFHDTPAYRCFSERHMYGDLLTVWLHSLGRSSACRSSRWGRVLPHQSQEQLRRDRQIACHSQTWP